MENIIKENAVKWENGSGKLVSLKYISSTCGNGWSLTLNAHIALCSRESWSKFN